MNSPQTYNYPLITLNPWGTIAKRDAGRTTGFIETACDLHLEFVRIPAGTFVMGSSDTKYSPPQ